MLLDARNIGISFGERRLFSGVNLRLQVGDRIGLIGANGSGKTTLLNLLAGELAPDAGTILRRCGITYIRQFSAEEATGNPRELSRYHVVHTLGQGGMSGGELTRVKLANAFSGAQPLVFADEPTANLDAAGVRLLTQQLAELDSLLLVSHDRQLLNAVCNRILEIRDGKLWLYEGNYAQYRELREAERSREREEYTRYIRERQRLEAAAQDMKRRAAHIVNPGKAKRTGNDGLDSPGARSKGSQQKNLQRAAKAALSRAAALPEREKPREQARMRLDFALTQPPEGKVMLTGKALCFAYGEREILRNASFLLPNGSHAALLGPNGCGKTTLLRLIAAGNPGISQAPRCRIGLMRQDFGDMDPEGTVLDYVMQDSVQSPETVRGVLGSLLFRGDAVFRRLGMLSGGERVRAALARLVVSSANLLLLDEPTNYLDIESLEAVQATLRAYAGTLLFVSHDREFVRAVANRLFLIRDRRIESFPGTLDAYEERQNPAREDPLILRMRLAKLAQEIATGQGDREALETQYRKTAAQLREAEREKR